MKKVIILVILIVTLGVSQEKPKKVKLVNADKISMDKKIAEGLQILIGNVIFDHEGTIMKCDSATFNNKENTFNAYKNVRVNQGDTLTMTCKFLYYEGTVRKGYGYEDVVMKNKTSTLYTEEIIFDRNTNQAIYPKYGKIIDSSNVIESEKGIYFTNKNTFQFLTNVVVTNPKYIINSENMLYNTDSKITYFNDKSTITSDSNFIYTEKGEYNTNTDISEFTRNSYLQNKNNKVHGDTLYYDRNLGFGKVINNVVIEDTLNKTFITAEYSEIYEKKDSAIIIDNPVIHFIDKKNITDTLFMYSDTILITQKVDTNNIYITDSLYSKYDSIFNISTIKKSSIIKDSTIIKDSIIVNIDSIVNNVIDSLLKKRNYFIEEDNIASNISSQNSNLMDNLILQDNTTVDSLSLKNIINDSGVSIKKKKRRKIYRKEIIKVKIMRAFHRVKFYKKDMQGLCDSIYSNETKRSMKMIGSNPVIWSENNQMTGDTIYLIRKEGGDLDSIKLIENAFVISQDEKDNIAFQQIKGKFIKGKFINNKMKRILVLNNAETVYYVENQDGERQGINKSKSSRMIITLYENDIEEINFLDRSEAQMYPESKLPPKARVLKGFIWRDKEKPKSKNDIFPNKRIRSNKSSK